MKKKTGKKIRYGVVGLGWIAQSSILPAFKHAKRNSELAALISTDEKKLKVLGKKYGVKNLYHQDQYEACLRSGDIDAIFIALPNNMHAEYAVAAARAGVHVLCEKPLSVSVSDCERMIEACDTAGVQLMTAYRLHFEPGNLEAVKVAHSGKIGDLKIFNSIFSYVIKDRGNIRLQADKGGGPLYDIGIYCINAARYIFKAEPTEVSGVLVSSDSQVFSEVEETFAGTLKFSDGRVAQFSCSFGAFERSFFEIVGTKGSLRVEPAYEMFEPIKHQLTVGKKTTKRSFAKRDQFAPELLYFSDCILSGKEPEPSGLEGLIDVDIMESLMRSARDGITVCLDTFPFKERPTPKLEKRLPPIPEQPLVRAVPAV